MMGRIALKQKIQSFNECNLEGLQLIEISGINLTSVQRNKKFTVVNKIFDKVDFKAVKTR
jgi:hypothetical protein